MQNLEPVNRNATPPLRNLLPAVARAVAGSPHGTNPVATMEVQ